jgi:predicted NAD/FAD-dependent oxidoreductase
VKIAIIGAGISGLRLARRLDAGGIAVELFEKARGPSGRLSTRRSDVGAFDHGAQYMTVRDVRFREQVDAWLADGVVSPWQGRVVRWAGGVLRPEPRQGERYVGTPRMSAIGRALAGSLPLHSGVRIERLSREGDHWTLVAEEGTRFDGFDAVVAAVPAPQAVPLLEAAPTLRDRAASSEMLPCHATMVAFEQPLAADFDGAFVEGGPLAWVAREASKADRVPGERWVLHSAADWSAAHVDDAPEIVGKTLIEALGAVVGKTLPKVVFETTHRWLYARPARDGEGGTLWDPTLRLGACGDWLRGGRVEEAFIAGDELADVMLSSLPRNPIR